MNNTSRWIKWRTYTSGDVPSQYAAEFDDRTVRKLQVFFASHNVGALAPHHQPLILPLQQYQQVLEKNDMQIDLFISADAPRHLTVVDHSMSRKIQFLKLSEKSDSLK